MENTLRSKQCEGTSPRETFWITIVMILLCLAVYAGLWLWGFSAGRKHQAKEINERADVAWSSGYDQGRKDALTNKDTYAKETLLSDTEPSR